jgi:hypothetical protein
LKVGIKLRPYFAPAYHLAGLAYLAGNQDAKEGVTMVRNAILYAPKRRDYLLTLAQLQIRDNDLKGAKSTLGQLLKQPDGELQKQAGKMLEEIDKISAGQPVVK